MRKTSPYTMCVFVLYGVVAVSILRAVVGAIFLFSGLFEQVVRIVFTTCYISYAVDMKRLYLASYCLGAWICVLYSCIFGTKEL